MVGAGSSTAHLSRTGGKLDLPLPQISPDPLFCCLFQPLSVLGFSLPKAQDWHCHHLLLFT